MPRVGHFRSDAARAHFTAVYRTSLAELPHYDESFDIATSFGTVRVYRFAGPAGCPVVLLPGRNASTPMWRSNLPGLLTHRTVFTVDLLGEAGLSVQDKSIDGPEDEARWLDEALAGLGLEQAHLMGLSIGGWTAVNYAARRPGRTVSIALLDPVLTFAGITVKSVLASLACFCPACRKRCGGACSVGLQAAPRSTILCSRPS